MNMTLIIIEVNCGAIDVNDSTCRDYYIIIFLSSPYTLQTDLNIDCQVICFGKMLCEGTYYFPININSHYYVSPTF